MVVCLLMSLYLGSMIVTSLDILPYCNMILLYAGISLTGSVGLITLHTVVHRTDECVHACLRYLPGYTPSTDRRKCPAARTKNQGGSWGLVLV